MNGETFTYLSFRAIHQIPTYMYLPTYKVPTYLSTTNLPTYISTLLTYYTSVSRSSFTLLLPCLLFLTLYEKSSSAELQSLSPSFVVGNQTTTRA